MADQPSNVSAAISLPKGGGAIRGIGETFQPNMFSGTGNFGVPIITSQGRDGFAPTLAIHYSSGNGNGPFGLGWQLSIPRIARKTEKGLPTYTDDDVFVISGSEDLVPWMTPAADNLDRWEAVLETCGEYTIAVYRPRTEGGFVRIQKWTHANGDVHWRAVTPENVTSIYGRTTAARVSDPDDADRVFEWLLEETFDARGNHVFYEYVRENPDLQLPGVSEQNRSYAQVFIRRILYGNTPDALEPTRRVGPTRIATDHRKPLETRERHYVFEVLFDYGDLTWPLAIPTELPQEPAGLIPGDWPVRPDPFSTFRAGFELRSLRLCERVLMLHHFDEPGMRGAPLVKSTDFTYDVDPRARLSLLTAVTVSGYREDSDAPQQYFQRSLPPVAFKYTTFEPRQQRYQSIQAARGDLPPRGLSAPELTVVDLFGDGLPDILQADATGFTYWRNRGEGRVDDGRALPGEQPAHSFAQANVAIADLGGDGLADLVVNTPAASGFYESTPEGRWRTFQPFEAVPAVDLGDPNARFVDLTGDGLSDILVTRDDQFVWYPCLGESGYDAPRAVPRRHDQAAFPDVFFDDPTGRVRLADMSGDGLSDIVLVHDGRIDYWPNLGYGHFGPRLTMANAPHIGYGFDPKRLFLVDLDGSGCADLVYVDVDCVHLWLNQSGNGWSEPDTIRGTPRVTDVTDLRFSDFFGTGTSTLLWSDDRGTTNDPHYKALDFCGGRKPHLLLEMDNNMGTTTRVQYAASTKFCLEDAARGTPWITSLPFPVHVVEKTEVIDRVSRTKLVTTYRYHHGYYDGREREFRGFGRVDQCDTEFFEDFVGAGLHEPDLRFDNGKKNFHTAPVETRTWFHTGIWFGADTDLDYRSLEERYRREYYDGDSDAFSLGDHEATPAASDEDPGSLHDAYRALRGAVLRAEVYGRDDSGNAGHPYSVSQTRYAVKALQPRGANRHGVYIVSRREGITNAYERHPADPRVTATLEGEPDEYGNVSDAVTIAYPRRVPSPEVPEQAELHIVYNRTDFLNRHHHQTTEDAGFYYARIPFQTRSYEVTGKLWQPGDPPLTQSSLADLFDTTPAVEPASFMPYEWEPEPDRTDVARRIIEWTRKYFRSDAAPDRIDAIGELEHRLLLGEIQSLGLPYEEYRATFTESHVRSVYGDRIADVDLPGEGGYHPHANHPGAEGEEDLKEYWWTPSGRQGFDPATFYSARRSQDPFGNVTTRELDRYGLATASIRDALPAPQTNVISARQDYRVLQPWEVTDANGNRAQVAFDVFGFVSGTAVMGKAGDEIVGDSLEGFVADLSDDVLTKHLADPLNHDGASDPHDVLQQATARILYGLHRFAATGQPNVVYTLSRETHAADEGGTPSRIQHAFVYSDGFGREVQRKIQAPAGWVGSGWTVLDNKGRPVQQFEPFVTDTHEFEPDLRNGVSSLQFYDPLGRSIAMLHPNHTWNKVVFDPWRQEMWDVNDTVLASPDEDPDVGELFARLPSDAFRPTWYARRHDGALGPAEQAAAAQTVVHANTPHVTCFDAMGRSCVTVAHNRIKRSDTPPDEDPIEEFHRTRVRYDIESNERAIVDALDRLVVRYDYDMLGHRIHQASMEAGERWILSDVAARPIRAWDSREQTFRTVYDALGRPIESYLRQGGSPELLVGRTVFGEVKADAEAANLRGRIVEAWDQAGVVVTDSYDFKGNLLRSRHHFAAEYKTSINWTAAVPLEPESFENHTAYDALNRQIESTAPDGSIIRRSYDESNLLQQIDVLLPGASATPFVSTIEYNARGQRTRVRYGNGVETRFEYDSATLRLSQIRITRGSTGLQDLRYTYDPVGNVTQVTDDAQQTIFFRNVRVEPTASYIYDAVYWLIEATGREHVGQNGGPPGEPSPPDAFDWRRTGLSHPGDGKAMSRYVERYVYDPAGNIRKVEHRVGDALYPGWTRSYSYEEPGQVEPEAVSNRLTSTSVGDLIERYRYDGRAGQHGNITAMPHLPEIEWDHRDQIRRTSRQVARVGAPESTYYVYDGTGRRVRKVTERQTSSGRTPVRSKERLYVGGFEIGREYENGEIDLERQTLQINDNQQRVALIDTRTHGHDDAPEQSVRYQLGNDLDSVSLELDADGQIVTYEEYFPFGSTSYQAVRAQTELPKRYRHAGMERDEESGFYCHGVRYYAPWLARWTSPDPAGRLGGPNLYAYASNSPVTFADATGYQPQGEQSESEVWVGGVFDYYSEEAQAARRENTLPERKAMYFRHMNREAAGGSYNTAVTEDWSRFLSEAEFDQLLHENPGFAERYGRAYETLHKEPKDFHIQVGSIGEIGGRPVATRTTYEYEARKVVAQYEAGAPLQGPGVVVGAPVYGVLRLIGFDHEEAVGWADVTASGVEIGAGVIGGIKARRASAETNASRETDDIAYEPNRAKEIHQLAKGKGKFRDLNPTVVIQTEEGVTLVVRGPTKNLTKKQQASLRPGERAVKMRPDDKIKKDTVPKDQRIHPDVRGLVRASFENLTPTEATVAGQEFCTSCQAVYRAFGGVLVTPFRAVFGLTPD